MRARLSPSVKRSFGRIISTPRHRFGRQGELTRVWIAFVAAGQLEDGNEGRVTGVHAVDAA
jgi:hypothetical protein